MHVCVWDQDYKYKFKVDVKILYFTSHRMEESFSENAWQDIF